MARPKRVDGDASAARATGILAEVPTVAALERRLAELLAESGRVERLLECLRGMGEGDVIRVVED